MKKLIPIIALCSQFFMACESVNSADGNDDKSSSSVTSRISSSSVVETYSSSSESSSSKVVEAFEPTFVDYRDGQTYGAVKVENQIWMAQNLNYQVNHSFCYDKSASNCDKYGRLYTWAGIMDTLGGLSTNGKGCGYGSTTCAPTYPVQGICPQGWHLPSKEEFETLIEALGGKYTSGPKLKAKSGWKDSGNGTDDYDFSALPSGRRTAEGVYDLLGEYGDLWSSSMVDETNAYVLVLTAVFRTDVLSADMRSAFAVRCIKD